MLRSGYVDAVITEDSDLLAYGAPRVSSSCNDVLSLEQVIVKLDDLGNGQELVLSRLGECKDLDFTSFTQTDFRHMCIFAGHVYNHLTNSFILGCDYVANVPGIGVKKAYDLVAQFRDPSTIFRTLVANKANTFPQNYAEDFRRADLTFQHQVRPPNVIVTLIQRIYNPALKLVVHLEPLVGSVMKATSTSLGLPFRMRWQN